MQTRILPGSTDDDLETPGSGRDPFEPQMIEKTSVNAVNGGGVDLLAEEEEVEPVGTVRGAKPSQAAGDRPGAAAPAPKKKSLAKTLMSRAPLIAGVVVGAPVIGFLVFGYVVPMFSGPKPPIDMQASMQQPQLRMQPGGSAAMPQQIPAAMPAGHPQQFNGPAPVIPPRPVQDMSAMPGQPAPVPNMQAPGAVANPVRVDPMMANAPNALPPGAVPQNVQQPVNAAHTPTVMSPPPVDMEMRSAIDELRSFMKEMRTRQGELESKGLEAAEAYKAIEQKIVTVEQRLAALEKSRAKAAQNAKVAKVDPKEKPVVGRAIPESRDPKLASSRAAPAQPANQVTPASVVNYRVRGAMPGQAWIAPEGASAASDFIRVVQGTEIPGYGRVQSIGQDGGGWYVQTTTRQIR